jgi:hypothetical protein
MMRVRALVFKGLFHGVDVLKHNRPFFAGRYADYVPFLTLRALHERILDHATIPLLRMAGVR